MKSITALILILGSTMAYAGESSMAVPDHPKWKEECGSCHIAYPPKLLTRDNWASVMNGLDKHFGANAVLDEKDSRDILDFLQRYAGKGNRFSASSLRISDTPWFMREHREVTSSAWSDKTVKSASNCTACHINAERGDWSEDSVRMPGGARMRDDDDD